MYKKINNADIKKIINSTYSKLDYSIKLFDRRLNLVNNILKDDFLNAIEEFYSNQSLDSDCIAEDFEIINKLYNIGTYLITSSDIDSCSKLDDKFHNDMREFHRAEEKCESYSHRDDFESMIPVNDSNYKLDKSFTMTNLKKEYLLSKEYISDYLKFLNYLKNLNNKNIKLSTKEIENDIVLLAKRNAIIFKAPLPDSSMELDLDTIDLSNINLLKLLLKTPKKEELNYLNDFDLVLDEFYTLLKNTPLKENELKIVDMLQNLYSQSEIAKELNTTKQNIQSSINCICKKLQKQHLEDLEDYIYTFKEKGTYKKCSRCNEIKLISKFSKDKKSSDGHKASCKSCNNTKL